MKKSFPGIPGHTIRRFIRTTFPNFTQNLIHKALRSGDIKVNSKKPQIDYILQEGDQVQIWDKLLLTDDVSLSNRNSFLTKYIIDKTPDFWVINKPSGLAMQGGTNLSKWQTMDFLLTGLMDPQDPHLVHRLDKHTSGVCLVATGSLSSYHLASLFADRKMQKTYVAVCHNNTGKQFTRGQLGTFKEDIEGKKALTHYKVMGILDKNMLLIKFQPVTGRKHQLRRHCAMHDIHIAGDSTYYPNTNFRSMYLHAYSIKNLVQTEAIPFFEYTAPLPDHMKQFSNFICLDDD